MRPIRARKFQQKLFLSFIMCGSLSFVLLNPKISYAENMHIIDEDDQTGFAIYRSGRPDMNDIREFCRLGIQEIMVLSGNASEHEEKYKKACPTLKVVYNEEQFPSAPLSRSFLENFDTWVELSKKKGKKIAFRCNCGCHRTGRLAAYYQMKYQKISPQQAKEIMNQYGKYMYLFPYLEDQVDALYDYINNTPCTVDSSHCVTED